MNNIRYWSKQWAIQALICLHKGKMRKLDTKIEISDLRIMAHKLRIYSLDKRIKHYEWNN